MKIKLTVAAKMADLSKSLVVLGEYPLVVLSLNLGHLNPQDLFNLGRQRSLNVLLHATQQERLQLLMQVTKPGLVGWLVLLFKSLPVVEPTWATTQQSQTALQRSVRQSQLYRPHVSSVKLFHVNVTLSTSQRTPLSASVMQSWPQDQCSVPQGCQTSSSTFIACKHSHLIQTTPSTVVISAIMTVLIHKH